MIDKLISGLPPALKPFVPVIQKMLPIWMEKLKFKTGAIAINDAEDVRIAAQSVVQMIEERGAKELRRVDMELEGKPVTVLILGDVTAVAG